MRLTSIVHILLLETEKMKTALLESAEGRASIIFVLSRNKKNNVYPCKPEFNYIKVGYKGVKII